jgi:hypothetical protein
MATYYISPSGDDSTGAGTYASPWETLTHAVSNSSSGDTIQFMNGTHTAANTLNATVSNRTLEGESVAGAIVQDGSAGHQWVFTDVTVQDMTLDFRCYAANNARIDVRGTCVFQRVIAEPFDSSGVNGGAFFELQKDADLTIQSCVIKDVKIKTGYNEWCELDGTGATVSMYNSVFIASTTANWFIFRGEGAGSNGTINFYNNIVKNKDTTNDLQFINALTGTTVNRDYNCLWDYGGGGFDWSDTNDVTSDPLFIDEDNDDFRLRPTSPCIDVGTII